MPPKKKTKKKVVRRKVARRKPRGGTAAGCRSCLAFSSKSDLMRKRALFAKKLSAAEKRQLLRTLIG